MDETSATGEANDAEVVTDAESVPTEDPREGLVRAAEAARAKVARQRAHLEDAERRLVDAEAALGGE